MPFANERLAANRELLAEMSENSRLRPTRFTFDPQRLSQQLRQRIIGQDAALAQIDQLLQVVRADLAPEQRPLGVCLLMGPTGVGKTETVRVLAELLHGNSDALCRIDMNTLSQEHYASALTGAPPGYVGSKEGHTLFDAEKIRGSYSKPAIVLFDELEKASTEVIRSLLNVLDSGLLTLPAGNRTIDFRNSLIFLTSNLGAAELAQYHQRFANGWRRWISPRFSDELLILDQALSRRFDPEFINRLDYIICYRRLTDAQGASLLDIELAHLNRRLARQHAQLRLGDSAREWLCRDYDSRYGARDIARQVRQSLTPLVAEALLQHPQAAVFEADLHNGQLQVWPAS